MASALLGSVLSIQLYGCVAARVRAECLQPHETNQVLDTLGRRGWDKVSVSDLYSVHLDKAIESWPPVLLPNAAAGAPDACTGEKTYFSDQVVIDGVTECGLTFSFSLKDRPGPGCKELLGEIRIRYASRRRAQVSKAMTAWLNTVRIYSGELIASKSDSGDKWEYYRADGRIMVDGNIAALHGRWVGEVIVLLLENGTDHPSTLQNPGGRPR